MYEPSHFNAEDRAALHVATRAHPFAMLVTGDKPGVIKGLRVVPESKRQAAVSLATMSVLEQSA